MTLLVCSRINQTDFDEQDGTKERIEFVKVHLAGNPQSTKKHMVLWCCFSCFSRFFFWQHFLLMERTRQKTDVIFFSLQIGR